MAKIKKLKENGQDIVPVTHEQAVLDSNGVTLDTKLNQLQTKNDNSLNTTNKTIVGAINELKTNIDSKYKDVILTAPNGAQFKLVVSSDGVLNVEPVTNNNSNVTRLIGVNRSVWSSNPTEFCTRFRELKVNELTLSCMFDIPTLTSDTVSVNTEDVARCQAIMNDLKSDGTWDKIKVIFEPYPYINNGVNIETVFSPKNPTTFLTNWTNAITNTLNTYFAGEDFFGIYVNSNMDNLRTEVDAWTSLRDSLKASFPNSNIMVRTNFWYSNTDDGDSVGLNTRKTHAYYKLWDILAVAAYFELGEVDDSGNALTATATTEQIYNWVVNGTATYNRKQKIKEEVKSLSEALGVKIFFGELNIPSQQYAVCHPYDNNGTVEDLQTQKNYLEAYTRAMIEDLSTESWFLGYSIYALSDSGADQDSYDLYSLKTNAMKPAGEYIAGLNVIETYPVTSGVSSGGGSEGDASNTVIWDSNNYSTPTSSDKATYTTDGTSITVNGTGALGYYIALDTNKTYTVSCSGEGWIAIDDGKDTLCSGEPSKVNNSTITGKSFIDLFLFEGTYNDVKITTS